MKQAHYLFIPLAIIAIALITHIPDKKRPIVILAEQAYKQVKKENPASATAELILKGSDFYFFSETDIKLCHVKTKESKFFPSEQKSECIDIVCQIKTNKKETASLSAPLAHLDHKCEIIHLNGGVTSELIKQ